MQSTVQSIDSQTMSSSDDPNGAKKYRDVRRQRESKPERVECETTDASKGAKSGHKSQIPRCTSGGRQRRHSDNQSIRAPNDIPTNSRTINGWFNTSECVIHGKPNGRQLLDMLENMSLNDRNRQIPDQIRNIHRNHVCNNMGQSRSVPSSMVPSNLTTPLSTPSTPTDSRKMSFTRNPMSQTSSPIRGSKSSLYMPSTARHTNQKTFAEYMPLCELQKGLQKGDIVEGVLRINPRNYTDAYISAPGGGMDIYVGGMTDRNRALNGDRVAVRLNPTNQWKVLWDTIRTHWDEWGQQFEELFQTCNQLQESGETSGSSAHTSHNDIETIDESHENDLNLNSSEHSNSLSKHLLINSEQNEVKKRRRSRNKNKNKGEDQQQTDVKTPDGIKTSLLKPEILNALIDNNNKSKKSKVYDELIGKLETLRHIKIDYLLQLSFCDQFVQKTAQVVAITEAIHPRIAGGRLSHMKDRNQNWALFIPNDSRMPRMRIPMNSCPPDFYHHSQHYTQSLFIAQLYEWKTTDHFPSGTLLKLVGNSGDIEAESEMILCENQIDFNEFPDQAFYGLPNMSQDEWSDINKHWTIPDSEFRYRRDFCNECVFTIDPSTARDLDDALSVKRIDGDLLEIGVHIADVTYFLKEGMPLDEIARSRATSVYLVQRVIPMLPPILCERLCSLNAGEEKLTFSVVWIVNRNGDILEEWFGRTMIRSCIKLSYELAQDMIDEPNRGWQVDELPTIHGHWSYRQISESVNLLNEVAVNLRKRRFENGALKIDKIKLHYILDKETGLPSGFSSYTYRDSNRLVEEFMLLANMAVARRIYKSFGDKSFLRCHPPPGENGLKEFNAFCRFNGFQVDTTSSLRLRQTLEAIVNDDQNISRVVAHYLLKAMQQAVYVCTGMQSAGQTLHHYALNVPLYTHFTSPIRRYADVIVHRLLSASLSYSPQISDSMTDLHRLAKTCNDKKLSSRLASEASARLFLNIYIKRIGKLQTKGIVVQVYDHSFDVMVINCGAICRIYLNQLPLKQFIFETKHGKNQLIMEWTDSSFGSLTIIACLLVDIQVSVNADDLTKLNAVLQLPNGTFVQNQCLDL